MPILPWRGESTVQKAEPRPDNRGSRRSARRGALGDRAGPSAKILDEAVRRHNRNFAVDFPKFCHHRTIERLSKPRLLASAHHRLRLLTFPMRTVPSHAPLTARRETSQLSRCDPFARDVVLDPSRATADEMHVCLPWADLISKLLA